MTNSIQYNAFFIFERRRCVSLQRDAILKRAERWLLAQTGLCLGINPVHLWKWAESPRCLQIEISCTQPSHHEGKVPLEADFNISVAFCYCDEPDHISLGDEEDELSAMAQWEMPHMEHRGLWESLQYDCDIKGSLLGYTRAALQLANARIAKNKIHSSQLIVLHGLPGVGKSSICRALANQVAEDRADLDSDCTSYLIEVNTAALFSKYFSESAKSITKIFGHVATLAAQDDTELIFILLDEVETIAVSRTQVSKAGENMETLRSVNTVLTQLDGLMKLRNVFVLATTNLLESVDPAFLDRADYLCAVPPPGPEARRRILRECLESLLQAHVIAEENGETNQFPPSAAKRRRVCAAGEADGVEALVKVCEGMSGRSLRRLPLNGLAMLCQSDAEGSSLSSAQLLEAMLDVAHRDSKPCV